MFRTLLGTLAALIALSGVAPGQWYNRQTGRDPFGNSAESDATNRMATEARKAREAQEKAAEAQRQSSQNSAKVIGIGVGVAGIAIALAIAYRKKRA